MNRVYRFGVILGIALYLSALVSNSGELVVVAMVFSCAFCVFVIKYDQLKRKLNE